MKSRPIMKIVLPIIVLAIGAGATAALISSRKEPERVERPALGPLVEVRRVEAETVLVQVTGQGEVHPRVAVDLAPQVSGRLTAVHPSLVSGGRFRAGEVLLEIDPRDYELAVERGVAAVASAETVLARERAEAAAAHEEWREVHGDEAPPALLVREPQIREAEAKLAAARADLAGAELALERTRISLPWNGLVIEESVDVGQMVTTGQKIATVYGTDEVEVRVPLDDRELAWFEWPGSSGGQARGPAAVVSADFAGARHSWPGRVDRIEGRVDPRSRMVGVIVAVKDPFSRRDARPPLLPGTFVDVAIDGTRLDDVVVLPRHALRVDDRVWVVDGQELDVRDVEVLRRERDRVYVGSGLEPGESVVVSSLDAVTDGMTVRSRPEQERSGGSSDV